MSVFNDLGDAADMDNSHWVATRNDNRDAQQRETGGSPLNLNIGSGSFNPAVGSPNSRSTVTSSPDLLRATPVTISHMSVTNLSREELYHCKVCDVPLSGEEPARQHYAGKQHKKVLQKAQIQGEAKQGKEVSLDCEVCQMTFSGEIPANQHYRSSKHLKAMEGASRMARSLQPTNPVTSSTSGVGLSSDWTGAMMSALPRQGMGDGVSLECEVCQKSFTSEISANDHYISSKHLKAVEGAKRWARSQQTNQVSSTSDEESPSASSRRLVPPHPSGGKLSNTPGTLPTSLEGMNGGFASNFSLFSHSNFGFHQGKGHLLEGLTEAVLPMANLMMSGNSPGGSDLPDGGAKVFAGVSSIAEAGALPPKVPLGASTGSPLPQRPFMAGMSPEAGEILRKKVVALCTTQLEGIMKQMIPHIANQVAGAVIQELGYSGSTTNPHREGSSRNPSDGVSLQGQGGPFQGEQDIMSLVSNQIQGCQSDRSTTLPMQCHPSSQPSSEGPGDIFHGGSGQGSSGDRERDDVLSLGSEQSMPPLYDDVSAHGSLVSGLTAPPKQNNLNKTSGSQDAHSEMWNKLVQTKKDGSL